MVTVSQFILDMKWSIAFLYLFFVPICLGNFMGIYHKCPHTPTQPKKQTKVT